MENELARLMAQLQERRTVEELAWCNEKTAAAGLRLSPREMLALAGERQTALRAAGRVEFGGGILKKLILAFYDSPYLDNEHYAETLSTLQESFYYFKSEAMETLTDDELLEYMRGCYDGVCGGSLEQLCETSLDELCRAARNGCVPEEIDPRRYGEWQDEEEE